MTFETEAAVARTPGQAPSIETVRLDGLRDDEVLVEVHATGICHMDVEAEEMIELPAVFGHEGAGIVVETGAAVTNVAAGDRVVLGYGFCGHCSSCSDRRPYFCDESWPLTFGGTRLDGSPTVFDSGGQALHAAFFQQSSFARHAITPARSVVRIEADVPWHVVAALPCGFLTGAGTAMNVLNVDSDSTLLVRGVGAVGLGAVMGARQAGCKSIVACDILPERLDVAADFGATECLDVSETDFDEWRTKHYPRGFTDVFNTTGHPGVFSNSVRHLATGGDLAFAILPAPMEDFAFKPFELFVRCASLKSVSFGSAAAAEMVPEMIKWWRAGQFDLDKAVGTFNFRDIGAALDAGRRGEVIKPVVLMD